MQLIRYAKRNGMIIFDGNPDSEGTKKAQDFDLILQKIWEKGYFNDDYFNDDEGAILKDCIDRGTVTLGEEDGQVVDHLVPQEMDILQKIVSRYLK